MQQFRIRFQVGLVFYVINKIQIRELLIKSLTILSYGTDNSFLSVLTRFPERKSCFSTVFIGSVSNCLMLKCVGFNDRNFVFFVHNKIFVMIVQQNGRLPPASFAPSLIVKMRFLNYGKNFPQKNNLSTSFFLFFFNVENLLIFCQTTSKLRLKPHFQKSTHHTFSKAKILLLANFKKFFDFSKMHSIFEQKTQEFECFEKS